MPGMATFQTEEIHKQSNTIAEINRNWLQKTRKTFIRQYKEIFKIWLFQCKIFLLWIMKIVKQCRQRHAQGF